MSMLMCPCGAFIDSDYDVECFMVDDEVACKRCRCEGCNERKAEDGYDICRHCLVEEIESDPTKLEEIGAHWRPEVIQWMKEADESRTRYLQEACGASLTERQAS